MVGDCIRAGPVIKGSIPSPIITISPNTTLILKLFRVLSITTIKMVIIHGKLHLLDDFNLLLYRSNLQNRKCEIILRWNPID